MVKTINTKNYSSIRVWHLGYKCQGTFFRCATVISTTPIEYQWLNVTIPINDSNRIIFLKNVTIPIPIGLKGPGPGFTIATFVDDEYMQYALNICKDTTLTILTIFPASTYTPPTTYIK
jgi:hypothetical protein